jgi:hypothetical protein
MTSFQLFTSAIAYLDMAGIDIYRSQDAPVWVWSFPDGSSGYADSLSDAFCAAIFALLEVYHFDAYSQPLETVWWLPGIVYDVHSPSLGDASLAALAHLHNRKDVL